MKESPCDFATLCTGVSGSGVHLSEDCDANPDVLDIANSASSQNREYVQVLVATSVSELGAELESKLDSPLQLSLTCLVNNVLDFLDRKFVSLTHSFTAPQNVSVQQTPVMSRSEQPRSIPPTVSHNQGGVERRYGTFWT